MRPRDIKCANVLVGHNGVVKLADFGMARVVHEDSLVQSTRGTPYWMAPEVLQPTEQGYSWPADIWSLGCTVLEMAEGKPPWSDLRGYTFMFKIRNGEIPPIPPHLSAEADDFIRQCLKNNPAERPSAAELLTHRFVVYSEPDMIIPRGETPPPARHVADEADDYMSLSGMDRSGVYYFSTALFDPVPSGDGQIIPGDLRLRAARGDRPMFPTAVADSSPTDLSSDPRVVWLLDEFADIFESPTGVVPGRPISHEIILEAGAVPPKGCIYRMSEEELEVLRAQLDDLFAKGWIRPSSSPYGAPVLFVRKKNKDLRLCIDYRKLNAQTVKNAGPLPCIDDLLERLGGAKYFSKLDLKSGYHQISIQPNDRYKTAFKTRHGHFEWVVMPFGLTNAPTTFQAAMTDEFRAMLDRFVLVYLDDILVYSRTLEDHLGHLRRVLETLRHAKYKANRDKCEFVRQELEYLGHFVTPEGISPLSDKIQAVQEWSEPRDVTNLHSFLGLTGYYQCFIKGYSKIAAHLNKLQCEDRPFDFREEARGSFFALKAALLSAEVLRIYDPLAPTLLQQESAPHASIDDARKKELLAFVHALKRWRHFLLGRSQFRWVTDNNPLVFYKTQDTVNITIARWMTFIDQFDFFPDHIPGKSNRFANALLRRPDHCTAVYSTFEIDDDLRNSFIRGYQADPEFRDKYANCSSPNPAPSHYRIQEGYLLVHTWGKDLCVPSDPHLRTRLLGEFHDAPSTGHFGVNRTIGRLRQRFWWPGLLGDVTRYCESCEVCRRCKSRNHRPYGELRPLPVPLRRREAIAMDITGPFPKHKTGVDGILTMVDRLTKFAMFLPCRYHAKAPELAEVLYAGWIRTKGYPKEIVCVRDARFMSDFWLALIKRWGSSLKPSSARHPQTDGRTERAHQTAQVLLRTLIRPDQKDWVERVSDVELYNSSIHPAIGLSPFEFVARRSHHPKAAQLQAEEAETAEKLRLQAEADADAQARRKEAQDLLQRHEANNIERFKFWHFEPNGDEATPEEQHKEFIAKLVTRLVYTCNHLQSELANLQRAVRNHKTQHEDATRALDARVQDVEQVPPRPDAGASSSAPSSRQLEERVDHVVAMLGDISTFAARTTISSQLHTLKTEVQQLRSTNTDGNPKLYKMPTFQLDRFDDYTQQDPVLWWEAFTTQLRFLRVAKHAYIGALFMNSKGGCQTWLAHLATSHGVDVPDLKDKITWEELTWLWKKRFIVDDAPALAINRLFTMSQGNTATRDRLTEWQKIVAVPNRFGVDGCAVSSTTVPTPLMDAGVEVVDLHAYIAKIDREFKTQRQLSRGIRASMRASIIRDDIEEMGVCFLHALPPHDASSTDSPSDPRITELLDAYSDVFEGPHGVVPDRPILHEIILEDGAVPPRGCIYRMSKEELSVLRAQLDDLLEKGWIRPSSSPYGAPVLFVRKKNKDLRLCIDYRKLNAQTSRNAGPLPRIDDLLEQLGGAKFFSKLDLKSRYHQLEIRQEDRYKNAFKTRYGRFEWLVMPFGLTNAPATFQAAMTMEFRHMLDRYVLIYLDDILVYSRSLEEHVEHLRTVLERLRQAKYKANRDKYEFARQELEYLGHYVTPQGIRPLADKIEALRVWPEPTNTTDVRSFMGLAGYYQRFITGYSRIAAPMTRSQSPKVPFVFDVDARRSFQALETTMLMAPVHSIYKPVLPTRHPVEYFSHKVPPINSLDDARKKELLAFVMALKRWRHFLLGRRRFTWVTDNNPLTYYKTQDTVSSMIGRWMYFIDQFDFTPKHLPGLSNRAADALSRRPDLCAMTHHAFALDEELQRHFIRVYESDPDFATLYAQLSSDHPSASHYRIVDGYLLLHSRGKDLLCVPRDRRLRTRLLGEYHDSRLAGHFGVNRTIARLRQRFRWPDLVTDVTRYCNSCEVCQRSKPRNRNPYGELRPMRIPREPSLSIAMDVTGPFPRDRLGDDGILTVVDRLSKYARFLPCKYYSTAPELARLLHTGWICGHGVPEDIVSDHDTRFMLAFWTALMQESDTKMKPRSAPHPQTDGQTERAHQTAQMMLRTLIRPDQKDWVDRLPDIEFAYNTSVRPAIGLTPFELHQGGRKGWIFADLLLPRPADIDAACSPASVRKYRELLTQARANMQKAQVRMQQQANRRCVPCPIRAGDLVWVSAEEFALEQDVTCKLLPKWFGPWSVTAATGNEPDGPSFVINIPEHLTVHPVFHASKLATYTLAKSDDFPGRRSQDPPSMDGHQEVDRVISDRKYGSKPRQYKVTFRACDPDDTRWISGADLKASAPLIYAHYERQRLAKGPPRPAPPTRTVVPPSDRQLRPRSLDDGSLEHSHIHNGRHRTEDVLSPSNQLSPPYFSHLPGEKSTADDRLHGGESNVMVGRQDLSMSARRVGSVRTRPSFLSGSGSLPSSGVTAGLSMGGAGGLLMGGAGARSTWINSPISGPSR
ncbi:hypothetical protein CBR_g50896 [Chara braunii]|uniref:Reverse transcriptase n=1 Tax=Chara braunii TaxID=69332 RepID=A0A388M7T9_CHABU|nr:hypothetical protein CBR_g50896 [Chara braunii]|eukprot:GBG90553.1 hypothetical protein CBR_g50896 [Chara braunii]